MKSNPHSVSLDVKDSFSPPRIFKNSLHVIDLQNYLSPASVPPTPCLRAPAMAASPAFTDAPCAGRRPASTAPRAPRANHHGRGHAPPGPCPPWPRRWPRAPLPPRPRPLLPAPRASTPPAGDALHTLAGTSPPLRGRCGVDGHAHHAAGLGIGLSAREPGLPARKWSVVAASGWVTAAAPRSTLPVRRAGAVRHCGISRIGARCELGFASFFFFFEATGFVRLRTKAFIWGKGKIGSLEVNTDTLATTLA